MLLNYRDRQVYNETPEHVCDRVVEFGVIESVTLGRNCFRLQFNWP
jgi:hypothetical protein